MPSAARFLDEGVTLEAAPSSPSATEFLDAEAPTPKAADFLDSEGAQPFNVTGESVGAPGDIARGFQDAGGFGSIPGELLQTLTPVSGSIEDLKRTYSAARDMITGAKTFDEAAKTYFPETQKLVGIEKKPIRQRVEAAADILMQMAFAGETAKGLQFSDQPPPPPKGPGAAGVAPEIPASAFPDQPTSNIEPQTSNIPEPPAAAAPSVAADEVIAQTPQPETNTAPSIAGDVFKIPSTEIATRPELMQFKQMDNAATGTATESQIKTPYDPIKANNLLLWEPQNPQEYGLAPNEKYIVANGHYRNEAAQQQNVSRQNAQILRESAGVSAADARGIAAWANIADGKGTVYDVARFIRSEARRGGPDAAVVRAREIGGRSRKAESIAVNSSDDLYTSFINEQITPEIAASIADAAPGNAALQRVGIAEALDGASSADIANLMDSMSAAPGTEAPTPQQIDLLASDDSAMAQMRESATRAGAIQKEIQDQISAVQGAAKRPEKAAALGVNVADPASVLAKLDALRALRERARPGVWKFDPEIRDIAMRSQLDAGEAVKQLQSPLGGPGTPGASEIPIGSVGKEPVSLAPTNLGAKRTPQVISDAGEKVWKEAKEARDEFTGVDATDLSNADRRELAGRGLSFTVDRQNRVIATYPQRLRVEDLRAKVTAKQTENLSLAAPESDAEMAARQQAEADANAARQASAEKQAEVKYGWQQKKTGDAGDLGQGDLIPPEQPDIFGFGPGAAASGEIPASGDAPMRTLSDDVMAALRDEKGGHAVSVMGKLVQRLASERDALKRGESVKEPIKISDELKNVINQPLHGNKAVRSIGNTLRNLIAERDTLLGDIFGFGPGAAAEGEMALRRGSQLKQLSAVVSEQLKTNTPPTERMNKAVTAAGKQPTATTPANAPVAQGASRTQATWMVLRNFFNNPQYSLRWGSTATDFMNALKTWQGLDQRTSFEVRQWSRDMRKRLDKLTDDAITNYIQADGDTALLQQRAAATTDPELKAGYERALNLSPEEQTIAANGRQYFDSMLHDGINAGILDHGLENYITQVWKKPNPITNALMADLQAGKLQSSFKFARKRIFDSYFEGEQTGRTPLTKRFSDLVAVYDMSFNRSLAARGLGNALRQGKALDGESILKFSGMVQALPRDAVPPEAYLIRASALPKSAVAADGRAYRFLDHPALRGWKLAYQKGAEIPTYYQADLLVHPDHWEHLNNVLKTSVFRTGAMGKIATPFLKFGALAKQTRLSLSVFHLDQEGLHGLFHRVNPANLERINFDDPVQWRLVRNGLQIADYSAMEIFSEGLRGGGVVAKIPGLGKIQNAFNEWLFKDYIPRLKMTMAMHAYDRNAVRYPKLSADVIAELTAKQGNAAFGELNYKLLGRSPTTQDFMRLTALAPDFLEGRGRFVGQALKGYGQEQRAALFLGAATLYATARVLNQWLDSDAHWEPSKAFSVIYNGREYRLRTVMGDAVALATDPRRFFYNRFSPWLKTAVTLGTGRDYRGIKLNAKEQVIDALSWFIPIPLAQGNEASSVKQWMQQFPNRALSSGGVENKPAETPIDHVYKAALDYKATLKDPKIQAEVKRAQQETYAQGDYSRLNRALIENDKERATDEIVGLMKDKGKTGLDLAKYYSNLPMSPFTGSRLLDAQWIRTMPAVQRQQYQSAVQQRITMARLFAQLYPMALQQYRAGK